MSKEANLIEEVKNQIKKFDDESQKHKSLYRKLRYTALILTGVATVLASVALSFTEIQSFLNMAIVVVTASTGVITSIEALRKPAELWIHERNILNALKDLKREIDYKSSSTGEIDEIDDYFNKLQQILGSSQEKWTKQVTPKEQNKS